MSNESLWGDLPTYEVEETPLAILEKQGQFLLKATEGYLAGQPLTFQDERGGMIHEFYVVAPFLAKYQVEILSVSHGAALYPAEISAPLLEGVRISPANDSHELKERLKDVFQHPQIRKIVSRLHAQSKASVRRQDAA